jgi:hypothetical protein
MLLIPPAELTHRSTLGDDICPCSRVFVILWKRILRGRGVPNIQSWYLIQEASIVRQNGNPNAICNVSP